MIGDLVQRLIGCAWGRALSAPDDNTPCPNQAVKIIVLHHKGDEMEVRLCEQHAGLVMLLTDPHRNSD
jgi:hypothetical protein